MNNRAHKSLGRGQALQRVMAQSINSLNVNQLRMANYTNEKIMEFLETITERTDAGTTIQNLEARSDDHLVYENMEDTSISFPQDMQPKDAVQSIPNKDRNNLNDSTDSSPAVIPGQFHFDNDDFPPLCEKG